MHCIGSASSLSVRSTLLTACAHARTRDRPRRQRRPRTRAAAAADARRLGHPGARPACVAAPVPVPATDGKVHLAYELQLTNALGQDVTLTSVAVRPATDDAADPGRRQAGLLDARRSGHQTPDHEIGPGAGRHRVARRRPRRGGAGPDRAVAHHRRRTLAKPMPPLLPATMTENDVAPVTVSTRKPVGHRAAAGRPELVGRQQLLRHDGTPDGAEPARRRALGR